ncbi:DUF305 domain-containing protein [Nonomuraea guangzhouensis]|uniref:DUF305 domain-containing protein n=1 Tax=Nonomuraea guangzhouensis TaxID=1291555 RepID=A0ABW4GZ06_9ACTN|nr:DUF305 domain-containing protein [Nonomuraea guangzhouensis]
MRWTTIAGALLCVALAGGCASSAAGTPATMAAYDQEDVQFSQEMITHHRQTIQLTQLVAQRTTTPYVRELSQKLEASEKADIEKMSSWLKSWQVAVPVEDAKGVAKQVAQLTPKSGKAFDKLWLALISAHLDHGVMMASAAQTGGKHGPTIEMATRLVTEQTAEIAEIKEQLA